MKSKNLIIIKGTIEVETGLHIGGGNETVEIGGLDNAVIKNPLNNQPYIPGSSIKGKMRFLAEWEKNKVENGDVHKCNKAECQICRVFGTAEKADGNRGPTRLIVRDAHIKGDFDPEKMLEIKYSTAIDRLTGTAKSGSLRNMERVAPGTQFNFEMVYRVFDLDDGGKADTENFKLVAEAMKWLEKDTLGGSGSRGCGRISFKDITIESGNQAGNYAVLDDLLIKMEL